MKINKIYFVEKFLLATFPMALAVGCATVSEPQSNVALVDDTTVAQSQPVQVPDNIESENIESDMKELSLNDITDQGDSMASETSAVENMGNFVSESSDQATSSLYNDETVEVKLRLPGETPDNAIPEKGIFYFGAGKYEIVDADHEALKQHALYLKGHPGKILFVDGFADSRGPAHSNYQLSKKRAQAVANLLITYGAPEDKIKVNGYGESFPLSNDGQWDENRRVELEYADTPENGASIAGFY